MPSSLTIGESRPPDEQWMLIRFRRATPCYQSRTGEFPALAPAGGALHIGLQRIAHTLNILLRLLLRLLQALTRVFRPFAQRILSGTQA